MTRVAVLEITNTSSQLITFGYSSIDARLSASSVPAQGSGILKLASRSSISIEEQRVERGELEEIQKKGLIRFEIRSVERPEIPVAPCFDLEDKTYFVGFPIEIVPQNVDGTVAYWSAPELPAPLSLDPITGVITAPVSATPHNVDFYVSAVGPDNLACTRNFSLRVEDPDIIDVTWSGTNQAFVPTGVGLGGPFSGFGSVGIFPKPSMVNYWVDWGDGTVEYIDDPNSQAHNYAAVGTYNVRISGELSVFEIYWTSLIDPVVDTFNAGRISSVNEIRSDSLTSLGFGGIFSLLTSVPAVLDAPNVTAVSHLFYNATSFVPPTNVLAGMPNLEIAHSAFSRTAITGPIASWLPLLSFTPNLRTATGFFQNNTGLTGSVPVNLLDDVPAIEDVSSFFGFCQNLTGSIPSNIFANSPSLTNATAFVQRNALTSITPDVFTNAPALENVSFFYNQNSTITGSIPTGVFDSPTLRDVSGVFSNTGITGSIPVGIFDNCPNLEDVSRWAVNTGITGSIPVGIFDNVPNLRFVNEAFLPTGLTGAVPVGIFDNNPLLEEARRPFFATGSGPIPPNLFVNNPLLRLGGVGGGFSGTIPVGLFADNPLLEDVLNAFSQMPNIVGPIPGNLFANNPLLRNVSRVFSNSGLSGLPANLFANNPLIDNITQMYNAALFTGPYPSLFGAGNVIENAFSHCNGAGFSSIPSDVFGNQPLLGEISFCFANMSNLVSVAAGAFDNIPNVYGVTGLFNSSSNVGFTSLPMGLWDNMPLLSQLTSIFIGTNLNAVSIDDFLISIDTNNVAVGFRQLNYSGTLSGGHLDVNRSPAALVAKGNLIANGWILSGTY